MPEVRGEVWRAERKNLIRLKGRADPRIPSPGSSSRIVLPLGVLSFARASLIKYHRLGGLNNTHFFLTVWRLEVEIKVLAGGAGFF